MVITHLATITYVLVGGKVKVTYMVASLLYLHESGMLFPPVTYNKNNAGRYC